MSSTSTIVEWIQAARAQHAHKLLLRGNTPPLIKNIEGTKLLTEERVKPTVVLSFALQLIKQSGQDADISRVTTLYLKAQSKKMGHLRAQIFRQRGEVTVTVDLCDGVLPSWEEHNIGDEILEELMQPGVHLISGFHARMHLYGLVAIAAQNSRNHPVVVAKGRPYEIPTGASHLEIPFDIPNAEAAVAILPDVMSSQLALDLPPSFLGTPEITALSRNQPVWQRVERPNHDSALKAVSNSIPSTNEIICGGLDDNNYHPTRTA